MPPADDTDGSLGHTTNNAAVGPFRRLLFAAIGLASGNAALLLFLLYNSVPVDIFSLYAPFSVLGWIFVGVPIAIAFPARLLARVAWPFRVLIGAALGPLALLLIFVALFAIQGSLSEFSLAHTDGLWLFSGMVSTISFLVYAGLLLRRFPRDQH